MLRVAQSRSSAPASRRCMAEARTREGSGKFGEGAFKDEPWSLIAIRKRLTALRAFYLHFLDGPKKW